MKRSERRSAPTTSTVLIVDDEADIRELLELTLVRMGLNVEAAGNLAESKPPRSEPTFCKSVPKIVIRPPCARVFSVTSLTALITFAIAGARSLFAPS